jgi:hypothetical protein
MIVDATPEAHRVVRRPVRGALAGLLFGIGLAVLLVSFSVIALGTLAPVVVIGIGGLLGLVLALAVPARGAGTGGATASAPPSGDPPAADPRAGAF